MVPFPSIKSRFFSSPNGWERLLPVGLTQGLGGGQPLQTLQTPNSRFSPPQAKKIFHILSKTPFLTRKTPLCHIRFFDTRRSCLHCSL